MRLAKTAGFCMGVRLALNKVLEVINEKKGTDELIFTFGPIIHNNQVIELLNSRGVEVINDISQLEKYKGKPITVVIRSHGISPQVRKQIIETGANICDATCPRVAKVQSIIKKYYNDGYDIIIIGDKGHAEVIGLLGFAENKGYVISSIHDIENLPPLTKKICVIGQTTQDEKFFSEITENLKRKFKNVEIFDTICDSTSMRQSELKELAATSEVVIVVGGKNSANTARLASLASEQGTPTFHVETSLEIQPDMIQNFSSISITAGASTPNWIFLDVAEKVLEVKKHNLFFFNRFLLTLGQNILKTNIFISLGAASLTYASCVIQQIEPRFIYFLLSFLYIFSMYILNQFTEQVSVGFNYPGKKHFYDRHRGVLITAGILSGIASLVVSLNLGITIFSLLFIAVLMGIIYQVKVIPENWGKIFKYQRLKDIPASKDIFLALGWVVVIVLFPLLGSGKAFTSGTILLLVYVFTVVFIHSLIYGIRDLQGDIMIGKETLPILLGERKSIKFIKKLCVFLIGLFLIFLLKGWIPSYSFSIFLMPVYILIYINIYKNFNFNRDLFELIIDAPFLLSGLFSFFRI
ncbi:MAG: 4-hydroxy-3-methylbut-2-enyl diphosphate reductase [bacterium]|nr:4-hydroxy-3-methylbut-2-enyl diphosphate reductase [bacterium]